jgi:predicted nucleic acid-binding protein
VKKVFWGTNILLDIFLEREPFFTPAAKLWLMVEQGSLSGFVSTLSLTTIDFIVKRHADQKTARKAIRAIRKVFKLAGASSAAADKAMDSKITDFEDAIQYFCAIEVQADCIVTRNRGDFPSSRSSQLPIYSPEELLAILSK